MIGVFERRTLNVKISATNKLQVRSRAVANGTWTPGEAPILTGETLPDTVMKQLFPDEARSIANAGRTFAEDSNHFYTMSYQLITK